MYHANKLLELMQSPETVKVPGVFDGLSALLVEQADFQAAFLSGAGVSFSRFGKPDIGLVSLAEMVDTVTIIRERINIPLIVDIDTGYGNAINVQSTVECMERAGASALQIEDQVMPKRCGHMSGKEVINCEEMVGKIKAALDARECEQTMIIARTDALSVNGFDDATERAEQYLDAGADALFIEAPETFEQMQKISERFGNRTPLIHNLVEGGHSPVSSADELKGLNYKIALYPVALLHSFVPVALELLNTIRNEGRTDHLGDSLYNLDRMNKLLGTSDFLGMANKYR